MILKICRYKMMAFFKIHNMRPGGPLMMPFSLQPGCRVINRQKKMYCCNELMGFVTPKKNPQTSGPAIVTRILFFFANLNVDAPSSLKYVKDLIKQRCKGNILTTDGKA